jgi:hypothetical protein
MRVYKEIDDYISCVTIHIRRRNSLLSRCFKHFRGFLELHSRFGTPLFHFGKYF